MMQHAVPARRLGMIALFFGLSFVLHLLWENLQMPLYAGFEHAPLREHFWVCFKATATGDMFFMLTIYLVLAAVHRDWFWVTDRGAYTHPGTWIVTLVAGMLLAVSFELWAVYVDHRWSYAAFMPLLPIVQVGLTPVLQMILIPAGTFLLVSSFFRRS